MLMTKGTKIAAAIRTKANKLSNEQRVQLMGIAMQLIYE